MGIIGGHHPQVNLLIALHLGVEISEEILILFFRSRYTLEYVKFNV